MSSSQPIDVIETLGMYIFLLEHDRSISEVSVHETAFENYIMPYLQLELQAVAL